ncbi:nucleotidyl transferase AbiEii/AbiGii toxin family protein [Rhizobium leguminosarum]|uniref:nucleotidyl transferase AbiEii/AbiGii toxin family protein n=1 Tax=Rhizobium leguminosarum TaxID=384 RepID=UPI002484BC30|nr:nucleotidyl transferase AbiEii/AbiGii toxin family protein [Rhizobium leguminosarum]
MGNFGVLIKNNYSLCELPKRQHRRIEPAGTINSHTFYMSYTGPMRRERNFKVDMTRTEKLVFDLEAKPIIRTYDAFDFPDGRTVQTYALDEVATEKILALTDPARNQPRDLFDI